MGIFDLVNRHREPQWEAWPVAAAAETQLSARDELGLLVADICRDRGLHEAKIGVVMYLLAADPADEGAHVSAAPDDLALAEIVAAFVLEDPSARSLAAAAAFDAALRLHQSARASQSPVGPDAVWLRQAKAAIDRALNHDRGATEYHVLAAKTLAMQRRHAEALVHARVAIEDGRQEPAFLELAGACALEAGCLQESESLFARAQKLAPDSESAREGLTAARRASRLMAEIESEAALWPQPSTIIPKIKQAYDGDRDAMALLARAYYDGSPVTPNPAMAYMWFSLLARFGDGAAKERLRNDPLLWGNKNEGMERVERWMRARRNH